MREFDEQEYANLVKDKKVVAIGQAKSEPVASARPAPLVAIKDAILGSQGGIKEAILDLKAALSRIFSFEKIGQDRNDILEALTRAVVASKTEAPSEWTFTVERDGQGFIKQIKARRS